MRRPYFVRATLQLTRRINPTVVVADEETVFTTGTDHIVYSNIRTKWYIVLAENKERAIEKCKQKAGIEKRFQLKKTSEVRLVGNVRIRPIRVGITEAIWADAVWR